MNRKALLIIVAVAALVTLVVVLIASSGKEEKKTEVKTTTAPTSAPKATATASSQSQSSGAKVTVDDSGFNPKTVTIKAGQSVTWQNNSGTTIDIASDPHPTHTILPDLRSNALANGKSYTFTFTKAGSFGYHDHLNTSMKGTVVVQ